MINLAQDSLHLNDDELKMLKPLVNNLNQAKNKQDFIKIFSNSKFNQMLKLSKLFNILTDKDVFSLMKDVPNYKNVSLINNSLYKATDVYNAINHKDTLPKPLKLSQAQNLVDTAYQSAVKDKVINFKMPLMTI